MIYTIYTVLSRKLGINIDTLYLQTSLFVPIYKWIKYINNYIKNIFKWTIDIFEFDKIKRCTIQLKILKKIRPCIVAGAL